MDEPMITEEDVSIAIMLYRRWQHDLSFEEMKRRYPKLWTRFIAEEL